MYRLFHDGEATASLRKLKAPKDEEFGSTGEEAAYLSKLCRLLAKMKPHDQKLLLRMASNTIKYSRSLIFVCCMLRKLAPDWLCQNIGPTIVAGRFGSSRCDLHRSW